MNRTCYRLWPLLGVLLFATLLSDRVWAQEVTATVSGRVTDSSGAVVPGVSVEVKNTQTNQVISAKTDASGNYVAPYLHPGTYDITAEATGFKKFIQTGLVLSVNQAATLDIGLQLGTVNEEVTVSAQALMLDVANADRGTVMDTNSVDELPLNARNP